MAAKLEEIAGVFVRERQRFANDGGDVIIGELRLPSADPSDPFAADTITIKGEADEKELQPQLSYRFYGRWTSHEKYGRQFHFQTFIRQQPHSKTGILRYLQIVGEGRGLGHARSMQLWDKFGPDAVRIVRESPEVAAAAVNGWNLEQASQVSVRLHEEFRLESCTIDLMEILAGRGFPKSTAKAAIQKWGNKAAAFIQANPYLLMAFRGCGFKRCDAMYIALGLPPRKLKRQSLAAWYGIASDTEGHTWHPVMKAKNAIKSTIGGGELNPDKAMTLANRAGMLATMFTDRDSNIVNGGRYAWVAEERKAWSELNIADLIAASFAEAPQWPVVEAGIASEHQAEKINIATAGVIGLLGGSPGCGKSFLSAVLIRLIAEQFGTSAVAVAAPTGKAAVRISEVMEGMGIPIRARTIHSMLGVQSREDRGGWGFRYNAGNPLPKKFIFIDEVSMLDTSLMASLLAARAAGTHILFIGDINQLPPVGHGAPLRDFIAAGLPYGCLSEIRRNSGRIVQACAEIRDGKEFTVSQSVDESSGENLKVIEASSPDEQIEKLKRLLSAARNQGFDPIWDCQVLVPVKTGSQIKKDVLCKIMQQELNSNDPIPGTQFRVGDKIINRKNAWFKLADGSPRDGVEVDEEGRCYIANGELAEVISATAGLTVAKLSSPTRIVKIPKGKSGGDSKFKDGDKAKDVAEENGGDDAADDDKPSPTGCTFELGYALTIHSVQGSEWPMAIVMLDEYPGAKRVFCREAVTTAISRAKRLCFLVGNLATAHLFCRNVAIGKRKTFLRQLIEGKRREMESERRAASGYQSVVAGGAVESELENANYQFDAAAVAAMF